MRRTIGVVAGGSKKEWCDFEPGNFDSAEFYDSPHGRLHVRQPLHNKAGQTFGSVFDLVESARFELARKLGGQERLEQLLKDE